jgi:hypothetical protein
VVRAARGVGDPRRRPVAVAGASGWPLKSLLASFSLCQHGTVFHNDSQASAAWPNSPGCCLILLAGAQGSGGAGACGARPGPALPPLPGARAGRQGARGCDDCGADCRDVPLAGGAAGRAAVRSQVPSNASCCAETCLSFIPFLSCADAEGGDSGTPP